MRRDVGKVGRVLSKKSASLHVQTALRDSGPGKLEHRKRLCDIPGVDGIRPEKTLNCGVPEVITLDVNRRPCHLNPFSGNCWGTIAFQGQPSAGRGLACVVF
jgi:hypothetical protein